MARNAKVLGVYTNLLRAPRKLAIHSQTGPWQEAYEISRPATLKDFLLELFRALSASDPNFLSKLEQLDDSEFQNRRHRTRRYFAKEKDVLYIESPHLEKYAEKFGQYWLATNIGWKETSAIARLACKAAGIKYGSLSSVKL